jgi:pyruvate dehydrogenase E2 component (dihydrolipoamide acetyltransferase)
MSDITAIELPKWGMTMEDGVVEQWHLAQGQSFSAGDALCTIDSSKISNDLEAPFDGYLRRIVAAPGQNLPVGALLAVSADPSVPDSEIDAFVAARTGTAAAAAATSPVGVPVAAAMAAATSTKGGAAPSPVTVATPAPAPAGTVLVPEVLRGALDESVFATPHALAFAREHGIALGAVHGTGPAGRVAIKDIESAIVGAGGHLPTRSRADRSGPARSRADDSAVAATPVARRLAQNLGVNLHDCRSTGTRGRVCRLDVEEAARRFGLGEFAAAPTTAAPAANGIPTSPAAEPFPVPFSSMRRTIAARLQSSAQTSPHFRVNSEIVLDKVLALRADINSSTPGVKVSVNDLVVKATALALQRVPEVNVQFDEATQTVLRFADADISVAVAIPDGLITPIVRAANRKSVGEISADLSSLVAKAKAGKLKPEEFLGGTFSVSNLGMLGVTSFDAIINPPQAAILAVSAGIQRPVVESGAVVVRTVMEVSLASDHRVIDGALAATFVGELKAILQAPTQMLV